MKKRKKKLSRTDRYMIYSAFAAAAGIMIISASAVVSVHAYLTAQSNSKSNPFAPAPDFTYTDTNVVEPNGSSYKIEVDRNSSSQQDLLVKTAENKDKTAKVQNIPNDDANGYLHKPVFVRVTMVANIYDNDGCNLTRKYPNCTPSYTINTADWTAIGSDPTYYYYKKIISPGQDTSEVFTSVTINHAELLPSAAKVKISVIADTVQAVSTDGNWSPSDFSTTEVAQAWGKTPGGTLSGTLTWS
ncbi:MAG: hypothetical protein II828_10250 [Clostridia bacterium]|nr:hypothetical protein [Clostridia bacterium]